MPTGELFQEIYLDQRNNSLPAAAKIGPLVIAPSLLPVDPSTQKIIGDDMEEQLRAIFRNMDRVLEQTGCARGDVARVTLYMRQVSDRSAMNKVYAEWYPDENTRPPNKYVPAELPEGIHATAQIIAMPGGAVKDIEIEGIHHQDYMSLAGICGNLFTTSRLLAGTPGVPGQPQTTEELLSNVFRNAETVLATAGGTLEDITQVTAFAGSAEEYRGIVEKEWQARAKGKAKNATVNFVETNLGGQTRDGRPMAPRIELLAVIDK
jgi:enamine deaminase RidA (YjgF/YER057c/UK114 family)